LTDSLVDVFDFLQKNSSLCFSISDIMRGVPCSWVTARDSLVKLMAKGWVTREKMKGYKIYSSCVVVVPIKKT